MHADLVRKIEQSLETIASQYYRMMLVCEQGQKSAVRTIGESRKLPVLNMNLLLSERLKEYPKKRMAGKVHQLLGELFRETGSGTICLEHIEVLFDPALKQDVIQLLQYYSRNYTLIVSWPGNYDGKRFTYAVSGHPEYYECTAFDGIVIK